MSQYESGPDQPVSSWALGGIAFAGTIMVLIGFFQAIAGLTAIIDEQFYVVTRNYAFDIDVTAWGWIHLIIGVIVFLTGLFLFRRSAVAGAVAVVLAMLSAIANFFFIPYYPIWSLVVIALNVWVIWSLTRPGAVRA
jgi:hypothetical protein